ncbi:MAG: arylamine N-acetyltransferase family protein [Armatimonadota bacterium]
MASLAATRRSGRGSELELDAYLRRIGYTGELRPRLETLRGLVLRHLSSIPFEGLNPLLGWPVRLDLETLQEKLVRQGRGGYCFEQNSLLGHVLEALGFQVGYLASRVVWNQPEEVRPARSHMLLRVDLDDQVFLVDIGFGVMAPSGPLRLELETEQSTPHERFRIRPWEDLYQLQAQVAGEWKPLYRFDLTAQYPADYELSNWYTSTHPESPFVRSLVAARVDAGCRYTLINTELNTYFLDGRREQRRLTTPLEIRTALEEVFRLRLPAAAELDRALQRVLEAR